MGIGRKDQKNPEEKSFCHWGVKINHLGINLFRKSSLPRNFVIYFPIISTIKKETENKYFHSLSTFNHDTTCKLPLTTPLL